MTHGQLHIEVQGRFVFLQEHLTEQSFLQEHLQSSLHSSEMEFNSVQWIPQLPSLFFIHPHWFGEGSSGWVWRVWPHTIPP